MKNIIVMLAMAVIASCSNARSGIEKHNSEAENGRYRLTVSFISIGSGIDREAKNRLDSFIREYSQRVGVEILTESRTWGREGEIDYCLALKELTAEQQSVFVLKAKEILANSTRVKVDENASCR